MSKQLPAPYVWKELDNLYPRLANGFGLQPSLIVDVYSTAVVSSCDAACSHSGCSHSGLTRMFSNGFEPLQKVGFQQPDRGYLARGQGCQQPCLPLLIFGIDSILYLQQLAERKHVRSHYGSLIHRGKAEIDNVDRQHS